MATITQAITMLTTAYPTRHFDDEAIKLYTLALGDLHPVTLSTAIMNLIKTSLFMPSIAEIRAECDRISQAMQCHDVLDATEAWNLVYDAAVKKGYDRGLDTLPEDVRKVATSFWRDVCYEPSKNMGIVRAQFRDAYNAMLERKKRNERIQGAIDSVPALAEVQENNRKKLIGMVQTIAEGKEM